VERTGERRDLTLAWYRIFSMSPMVAPLLASSAKISLATAFVSRVFELSLDMILFICLKAALCRNGDIITHQVNVKNSPSITANL